MSRTFGEIPDYREGSQFETRYELSKSGIHRPTQAGISGSATEGADSIVLSGGYEDDLDYGSMVIYTGHGGRDELSGKQISNQELVRQNLALALSRKNDLPVRVVRGARHKSPYSPSYGYRYDGLFFITDHWREKGNSNYFVWRFKLEKLVEQETELYENRIPFLSSRVIRSRSVSKYLKNLYEYRCQICNQEIWTPVGNYIESAHIIPLGIPHDGQDVIENILCLCPNCHVKLDYGAIGINHDLSLINIDGYLHVHLDHQISTSSLAHHRTRFNLVTKL